MKPSSAPAKTKGTKARNAALMNLLGTPGLGSLMAGRGVAGTGQLLLAVAGFVLVCVWFYKLVIIQFYGQIEGSVAVAPVWKIGVGGAVLFVAAWLWSLVTSLSLLDEAKHAAKQTSLDQLRSFPTRAVRLEEAKIQASLASLPRWQRNGEIITRTYEFKDFVAAMKFVNTVAEVAEATQHHPDVDIRWNKVTLALTTHDAGGLTEKDFALAGRCDDLAAGVA
jgi:4a-hydroxytetrahydrobiopterin dehydratase